MAVVTALSLINNETSTVHPCGKCISVYMDTATAAAKVVLPSRPGVCIVCCLLVVINDEYFSDMFLQWGTTGEEK